MWFMELKTWSVKWLGLIFLVAVQSACAFMHPKPHVRRHASFSQLMKGYLHAYTYPPPPNGRSEPRSQSSPQAVEVNKQFVTWAYKSRVRATCTVATPIYYMRHQGVKCTGQAAWEGARVREGDTRRSTAQAEQTALLRCPSACREACGARPALSTPRPAEQRETRHDARSPTSAGAASDAPPARGGPGATSTQQIKAWEGR